MNIKETVLITGLITGTLVISAVLWALVILSMIEFHHATDRTYIHNEVTKILQEGKQ